MARLSATSAPAWTFAAFFAGLAAFDAAMGVVGPRHFEPVKRMRAALAQGDGCVLVLGDSRMEAGVDAAALAGALKARGAQECVADLSMGGIRIAGESVALRQYLASGGRPRVVVLGYSGDGLIRPPTPDDLSGFTGWNSLCLLWSTPSDVTMHYPGFPFRHFDAGFRFLAARATSVGVYVSVLQIKPHLLKEWLRDRGAAANRFGLVSDMEVLAGDFQGRALAAFSVARAPEPSPWFMDFRRRLRERGIPLLVVELPMGSQYREAVDRLPGYARYRAALRSELEAGGDGYADLSRLPWVKDDLFSDTVHLTPPGARLLSRDMAAAVDRFLASQEARLASRAARP